MTPFELVQSRYQFPSYIAPFPEQIDCVNTLADSPNQGLFLDMGCVDGETEYLSPTGWKRIKDYSGGPVAQWQPGEEHTSGRVTLVDPIRFIKRPNSTPMVRFKTARGVDQKLSQDHRVVYVSMTGKLKSATALDVFKAQNANLMGWRGRFITAFRSDFDTAMELDEPQLRLQVAVIADGHFPSSTNRCVVRLKKERKQKRLLDLLNAAGIDYTVEDEQWEGCEGFKRFIFKAPLSLKHFDTSFYKSSQDQLQIIVDEVQHWDSHVSDDPNRGFRFSTRVKDSATFIQYALSATGVRASMRADQREDGIDYTVQEFSRSPLAYLCGTSPNSEGGLTKSLNAWMEASSDGHDYCFEVPSGQLVLRHNGCIFVTGNCGKTFVSTVISLYHMIRYGHKVVVIMPPVLITQWAKWLRSITPKLVVAEYRGTPKERATIQIEDADFTLVGIQIFKKDYERFQKLGETKLTVVVDEATFIANIGTDAHEKVYEFTTGRPRLMLTGTPANKPGDAYGLMKFTTPGTYRNKKQFENMHVEERDFFNNPVKWRNLDVLHENLKKNSVRILFEDIYRDVDAPLFDPLVYDLDPDHYKLYKRLSEEELLKLPDGGKIDATTANKLTHALGQIIVNHDHFSGDPSASSAALGLIEEKLEELGDRKLVIFANYRMSISSIIRRFAHVDARAINSEVSPQQKDKNLAAFVEDPKCRLLVIQFVSGGKGLDGLQHVCNHCMFIEPCLQPRDFHQAVARLKRTGQKKRVHVWLATAAGTLQVRGFKKLLENDETLNQVVRNAYDLKQMIFGN